MFGAASERSDTPRRSIKTWRDAVRLDPEEFRNSEVASAAIAALARCENWPAALQTWRDLGDRRRAAQRRTATPPISVVLERTHRRWEEARDVFRAMRDEPGLNAGRDVRRFDARRRSTARGGGGKASHSPNGFADVYGVAPGGEA